MDPHPTIAVTIIERMDAMAQTLYTLEIYILEEAGSEEFAKANPSAVQTIEMQGDQTLHQLHGAVLEAFDRWEDYVELLFDDSPHDRGGVRYGPHSPFGITDPFDAGQPVGDAAKTSVDSLGLEVGQSFDYWFDLWDDCHHEITVLAIGETEPKVKYPRAIACLGHSPPLEERWNG
jgi:Plasmid pRiA4b ORF-3-like protein